MADLLKYLDGLSPFLQGVLGSAAFALIVLLGRFVIRGARHGGRSYFKFMSKDIVLKHVLHKEFVRSRHLADSIWGNFFVITKALHWSINAVAMLVFIFGVSALLEGKWLHLFGFYLALNALVEANSWLKDRSDETHIAYLDPESKKELLEKFYPKESIAVENAVEKTAPNPSLNQDEPPTSGTPVS